MSDNPIEDVTKGITKAVIELGTKQIKTLATKFKNKDVSFIENPEIITTINEERKSPEAEISHKYIRNPDFKTLAILGLTMRRMEKTNPEELPKYKRKIADKYGKKGLHISEFFQHGLFSRYIGIMVSLLSSTADLENGINEILENIDNLFEYSIRRI